MHHVFRFGRTKLTPMLEEVRRICGFSKLMEPAVFKRRNGYVTVLSQLTRLSLDDCKEKLVCVDGLVPMLRLSYFDEVARKRITLGDELWLRGFVTCFLGELIFTLRRMTVAIEIAEIALGVVTRQIDLAPVVLVETNRRLDRISQCCRHTAAGP